MRGTSSASVAMGLSPCWTGQGGGRMRGTGSQSVNGRMRGGTAPRGVRPGRAAP